MIQTKQNPTDIIQPFQPPEKEYDRIEQEILNQVHPNNATLQFMYFLVDNFIVITIQFLNAARCPYWCWNVQSICFGIASNIIKL